MSNLSTQSQSPKNPIPGSNGVADDQPTQSTPKYPQSKYVLEDFSQQAINRGQQQINYLIAVVDEKIVDALKQVSNVVAKSASNGKVDLAALDKAIEEVSKATQKIASIFPPGCVRPSQSEE